MKKRKIVCRSLLAFAVSICCTFPAMAQGQIVRVNCDVLRCRSSAEILPDNIVTRFYRGQELQKTGSKDGWAMIQYNGTTCYVSEEYITESITTEDRAGISQQENRTGISEQENRTEISLQPEWLYAGNSKINTGKAVLYRSESENEKNITVCVNAGHGTSGGSLVKTLCHPDGTPKVTGGTTGAGATEAAAVSGGMIFSDGTPESEVTLAAALILKEKLLAQGYDVLMIRETADVQLDNIARTVIANQTADCHIALHWDSTTSDKGAFFMSVPNVESYRAMEPVASNWESHHKLGEALIGGLREQGVKIFSDGNMAMDLTQTSYSRIPSVDIELGDKASDHSQKTLALLADGLVAGLNRFYSNMNQ